MPKRKMSAIGSRKSAKPQAKPAADTRHLTPAQQLKADYARFDALYKKYWKPPRPLSEREMEAWRRNGGLRDPGAIVNERFLPDGSRNSRFRPATRLCFSVCERDHCRREGRCLHTICPALRENMHWLLRVYYEYLGAPINRRVIAMERAAGIEHPDARKIMRKHPKQDPFAEIGGDSIAPLEIRKV